MTRYHPLKWNKKQKNSVSLTLCATSIHPAHLTSLAKMLPVNIIRVAITFPAKMVDRVSVWQFGFLTVKTAFPINPKVL